MNVLTDEQKNYINEHPCESPSKLAKSFGCTIQTIYWWLHKLHGDSFIQRKKEAKEVRYQAIRNLYPDLSATEGREDSRYNKGIGQQPGEEAWGQAYR